MKLSRRTFLQTGSLAAAFVGLRNVAHAIPASRRVIAPYGPLVPDPQGLLDLPEGFSYRVVSRQGSIMADGLKVPGVFDGMAAFPAEDGRVVLVRNHEIGFGINGTFLEDRVPEDFPRERVYDFSEEEAVPGYGGGTSNVVFNPETGEMEAEFLSLIGTDRNCAGGAMPWGTWITCEEPGDLVSERGRQHGYCFEVKATTEPGVQQAVPLKALGRFRHEAVALDPRSGILYLTEDRSDGLLYRFIPERPQDFSKGRLQALAVTGEPAKDLRNYENASVREGVAFAAEWIDLEDIDAPKDDLRQRGASAGAAVFARGEGIIFSEGSLYVCCTDGGPERRGQIYRLTPGENGKGDALELFVEASESDLLTNGDNLCAAPWGDLIICEDFAIETPEPYPHLRGVTPDGKIYTLARSAAGASELAGSCFSPDGRWLFVNVQNPGTTFAITGPWEKRRS